MPEPIQQRTGFESESESHKDAGTAILYSGYLRRLSATDRHPFDKFEREALSVIAAFLEKIGGTTP